MSQTSQDPPPNTQHTTDLLKKMFIDIRSNLNFNNKQGVFFLTFAITVVRKDQ